AEYAVFRGNISDFPLDDGHRVGSPTEPAYVDPDPSGGHYYKVIAVDAHGNTSPVATLPPSSPVPAPLPSLEFSLRGPTSNPVDARYVTIGFTLPDGSPTSLELYDTSGRRVAASAVRSLGAGAHGVRLGGALAAGGYTARLP